MFLCSNYSWYFKAQRVNVCEMCFCVSGEPQWPFSVGYEGGSGEEGGEEVLFMGPREHCRHLHTRGIQMQSQPVSLVHEWWRVVGCPCSLPVPWQQVYFTQVYFEHHATILRLYHFIFSVQFAWSNEGAVLQSITAVLSVAGTKGQVLDGMRCAGPSPGAVVFSIVFLHCLLWALFQTK